jgi:N-acetylglutamate synthase-like GNAT family acetyltransferase
MQLVNIAYRNLETLTWEQVKRLTSPPYFSPEGFFIAEKKGSPIGCIGVFNLPAKGYLEIRYLAVKEAFSNLNVVDGLANAALDYATHKKPVLLKAVTPTIQPYVDAYKRLGFKPVRRILRIAWDPIKIPEEKLHKPTATVIKVSESEIEETSRVLMKGLQPYWDWWVKEEGGSEAVIKKGLTWTKQCICLAAKIDNKIVGVTGVVPFPEREEAHFLGVIVLPNFRMRGIGSHLLKAALNKAKQLGYKRLVVHTMAYLDSLAPGAVLYLKSGGKIEVEYLHLLKTFQSSFKQIN